MTVKQTFGAMAQQISKTQAGKQTETEFQQLKDKLKGSKAEVIVVSIRMTKAEKRALKVLSANVGIDIQDLVRRGIYLVRQELGIHANQPGQDTVKNSTIA